MAHEAVWAAAIFTGLAASADHRPLLPGPQQITYGTGSLPLTGIAIRFALPPTPEDRFAAQQLASGLSDILGTRVPVQEEATAGAAIVLNRAGDGPDVPVDNEKPGPDSREAYSLSITSSGAEIHAGSSAGIYYGVLTLLQMVEGGGNEAALPAAEVKDWPALAYRGFMMDFSHGQLLRVSEIERQIDLMARFKGNQYYFYSEMNIELKGYEAVNIGARYTQDDVKHIVAYARQRHVDIVPCMELYGHMHDLFRAEKFADAGLPRYGDEFDPRNPRTLQVIDDLFDQTTSLFGSPWCHVGFDEPWSLGKIGVTPGKDPFAAFVQVLQHIADRAQLHGKRIIYWADVENPTSTLRTHPQLVSSLPSNAISAPWKYDVLTNYDPFVKPLADGGHPTLVTPAIFNWNEIFPDYHHTFANINGLVASGKKFNTLGVLNTGWTDCGQTLYRQSLPGIAFGAIAGWQSEPVNTNTFFSDYTALIYPADEAKEVNAAFEQLSQVEEMFEDILRGPTQHGFWHDPLQPGTLAQLEKSQELCHTARLLAEDSEEHIQRAMNLAPRDPTLPSLMMAARLFDYLGMKCLYAVEWQKYFKALRTDQDPKLITLYIGIQMNAQDHGMIPDLLDTITGLREPYREAWLAESTPYRLGTALSKWDGEERFWYDTLHRVEHLLRSHSTNEPFPTLDAIRAKN
jgi:hypothetical protein